MTRFEEAGQQALDPWLAEYVERAPVAVRAHMWIGEWMQNGQFTWLGNHEDRFSYISAIADKYPQGEDDFVYARLLISSIRGSRNTYYSLGRKRFQRGLAEMIERQCLNSVDTFVAYQVLSPKRSDGVCKQLDNYVVRQYGNLQPDCYNLKIPQALLEARAESHRQAEQKAGQVSGRP